MSIVQASPSSQLRGGNESWLTAAVALSAISPPKGSLMQTPDSQKSRVLELPSSQVIGVLMQFAPSYSSTVQGSPSSQSC